MGILKRLFDDAVRDMDPSALRRLSRKGECVVVCYNQAEVWRSRQSAIDFYMQGARECDGSEAERYMAVAVELMAGCPVCTDGVTRFITQETVYR